MLDADDPAIDRLRFQEGMASLPQAIRALPQPVVAAVNGPAVGGGLALRLAADVRICAASASFGNAAIAIGLSGAEMGMSYFLPRIVGHEPGRRLDAHGPHRHRRGGQLRAGWSASWSTTTGCSTGRSRSQARSRPTRPLGVQMTKRALQVNTDAADLSAAIELENRNQVITHATEESAAARQRWADR